MDPDVESDSQAGTAGRVSSQNRGPAPETDSETETVPLPLGQRDSWNRHTIVGGCMDACGKRVVTPAFCTLGRHRQATVMGFHTQTGCNIKTLLSVPLQTDAPGCQPSRAKDLSRPNKLVDFSTCNFCSKENTKGYTICHSEKINTNMTKYFNLVCIRIWTVIIQSRAENALDR